MKNNQTEILELKNTVNQIKNIIESTNSRLDQVWEKWADIGLLVIKWISSKDQMYNMSRINNNVMYTWILLR